MVITIEEFETLIANALKNPAAGKGKDFPLEGFNFYGGEKPNFDIQASAAIAASFFAGKTPPATKEKFVHIYAGAPGSGKTFHENEIYKNLPAEKKKHIVFVGYDEDGAIERIPGFKEKITAAQTYEARVAVWREHQKQSQFIRSLVLAMASQKGFSAWIDNTASSPHLKAMFDVLENKHYPIDIAFYAAPAAVTLDRIQTREHPASYEEVVSIKSTGVWGNLPLMKERARNMEFWWNPDNQAPAKLAATYSKASGARSNEALDDMIKAIKGALNAWLTDTRTNKYVTDKVRTDFAAAMKVGTNVLQSLKQAPVSGRHRSPGTPRP